MTQITATKPTAMHKRKQFVVECSAVDSGLSAAVCALYYLPDNYKLVVTHGDSLEKLRDLMDDQSMTGRVAFTSSAQLTATTPFVSADAVVRNGRVSFGDDDDAALDTPEALASALLTAARLRGLYD